MGTKSRSSTQDLGDRSPKLSLARLHTWPRNWYGLRPASKRAKRHLCVRLRSVREMLFRQRAFPAQTLLERRLNLNADPGHHFHDREDQPKTAAVRALFSALEESPDRRPAKIARSGCSARCSLLSIRNSCHRHNSSCVNGPKQLCWSSDLDSSSEPARPPKWW